MGSCFEQSWIDALRPGMTSMAAAARRRPARAADPKSTVGDTMTHDATPAVAAMPRLLLRLEGAALLALAVLLFALSGASWWLFAILILAPDLSFVAYLAGPRVGAIAYNAVHTTVGPIVLWLIASYFYIPSRASAAVALIWAAHIGADRMLGYGLKYGAGFGFTHLGRGGRATG